MKIAFLVCGLPLSGKTFIASQLSEALNAPTVDVDDYKRQVVDPKKVGKQIDPPDLRWGYYQLALDEAVRILRDGKDHVVLVEVFPFIKSRRKISRFLKQRGITPIWFEVFCSDEVAKARLFKHSRPGHLLSGEESVKIREMFSSVFDPVGDEGTVITNDHEADPVA